MPLVECSLQDYFLKELDQAAPRSDSLSLNVRSYLANMMCYYMSSDRFFVKKSGESRFSEVILLDLYKKSQNARGTEEKLHLFKKIGDFSLYFSGFFRSRVKKKIVPVSYYEQIGQTAYHLVGQALGSSSNVFTELAFQFKNLSQILFSLQKRLIRKNLSRAGYSLKWPS